MSVLHDLSFSFGAQGNVPYLKSEIRKLKDFITKLQTSLGLPPRIPTTPNGSLDCGETTKTSGNKATSKKTQDCKHLI